MKTVFADLEKLNHQDTPSTSNVVDFSNSSLANVNTEHDSFVLTDTKEYLETNGISDSSVYIPYCQTTTEYLTHGQHLYFDLENYPFYQKIKGLISSEEIKGVLRYRRISKREEDVALFIGDLYVLTLLLGEPIGVQVKHTKRSMAPAHTIVMMSFGGGTMAHIEYTVAMHERIKFEWSSVNNIIEFDSEQMKPIYPSKKTSLEMTYSIDAIFANAHEVNDELIKKLNYYRKLVIGGELS